MKIPCMGCAGVCALGLLAFVAMPAAPDAQQAPPATQTKPAPPAPTTAKPDPNLGYTDTPMIPGQPWHVHDPDRPQPVVVTPGATAGAAPSDAIVLFDGKDLSKWGHGGTGSDAGRVVSDAKWAVRDGYFEVVPKAGTLMTRESFGDMQLHIEWASPAEVTGRSQGRGNSGVILMGGRYEVQVLDAFNNRTTPTGGGRLLRPVPAARQRRAPARRMADLRHRLRGAALQGQTSSVAGVHDRASGTAWSSTTARKRRPDGPSCGGRVQAARCRAAADAAGPRQSRPVPQRLGASPEGVRHQVITRARRRTRGHDNKDKHARPRA